MTFAAGSPGGSSRRSPAALAGGILVLALLVCLGVPGLLRARRDRADRAARAEVTAMLSELAVPKSWHKIRGDFTEPEFGRTAYYALERTYLVRTPAKEALATAGGLAAAGGWVTADREEPGSRSPGCGSWWADGCWARGAYRLYVSSSDCTPSDEVAGQRAAGQRAAGPCVVVTWTITKPH